MVKIRPKKPHIEGIGKGKKEASVVKPKKKIQMPKTKR